MCTWRRGWGGGGEGVDGLFCCVNEPTYVSELCETRTSGNARCPSDSISRVNWTLGSMEFRCQWKSH